MKVSKHILFQLLFLTTVILCLAHGVYTQSSTSTCQTELYAEQNCVNNNIFHGADSFEDDHIIQIHEPFYFVEQLILIPISNHSFLLKEFSFSSWQPPKYS